LPVIDLDRSEFVERKIEISQSIQALAILNAADKIFPSLSGVLPMESGAYRRPANSAKTWLVF